MSKSNKQLNTYALLSYMAQAKGIGRSGRCLLLYVINRLAKAQARGKSVITFRKSDLRTAYEVADIKDQALYDGLCALRRDKHIPGLSIRKSELSNAYKAKIVDIK